MRSRLALVLPLLPLVLLVGWPVSILRGADTPPNAADTILQREVLKQQQIKATTKRVGDQLDAIAAEFDRNGISGEDVKLLRAIRGVLDKLSEKDMAKVLDYLQQSRAATDPTA